MKKPCRRPKKRRKGCESTESEPTDSDDLRIPKVSDDRGSA